MAYSKSRFQEADGKFYTEAEILADEDLWHVTDSDEDSEEEAKQAKSDAKSAKEQEKEVELDAEGNAIEKK